MATTPITTTDPVTLTVGGGTLWLMPLGSVSEAELLGRAHLTAQEQDTFNRFSLDHGQRRKEWLAGRVLAYEQLEARIGYAPSGQPRLISSSAGDSAKTSTEASTEISAGVSAETSAKVHISISHTLGWAALMVSTEGRCGVDIERADRSAERIVRRFAVPEEIELATAVFAPNPALLAWCAKEAAYKALGTEGVDFKKHIRLWPGESARTLIVSVGADRMDLEFFRHENLIGVCGRFKKIVI